VPRKGPRPHHVKVIRYSTPGGRRCRKDTPGAVRTVEESETYYAHLPDPGGGRPLRVSLETTDLGEAWVRLRQEQREAARYEAGVIDPALEHARKPLAGHVEDWLAAVAAGGASPDRVRTLRARVGELARLAGWDRITDVNRDSALAALAKLASLPARNTGGRGRSAETRNHYLRHLKQFCRWADEAGRLRKNPVAALRAAGTEDDRRHDRRCPTDEEVGLLFAHLEGGGARARRHMSGPRRALGYKLAMAAGLRAGELRGLARTDIDLDAGTVTVRAALDKRRRRARQPLPPWLVAELRAWLDAGGGLWGSFPAQFPGAVLKADLRAARETWLAAAPDPAERARRESSPALRWEAPGPDGPLYFDLHSLRVWYCTQIGGQAGISPKAMMTLCRHSNPTLTLKIYAKAREQDLRAAADLVPKPGDPRP
jgi:integrase